MVATTKPKRLPGLILLALIFLGPPAEPSDPDPRGIILCSGYPVPMGPCLDAWDVCQGDPDPGQCLEDWVEEWLG